MLQPIGKQVDVPLKYKLPLDPEFPHFSEANKNVCLQKVLMQIFIAAFNHNSLTLEAIQMLNSLQMDKQKLTYPYNTTWKQKQYQQIATQK